MTLQLRCVFPTLNLETAQDNASLKATITALQQNIAEQTGAPKLVKNPEGAQFVKIEHLEKLQDENQLLQRISGMQEAMSILSSKHDDYFEGDQTISDVGETILNASMVSLHLASYTLDCDVAS